MKLLAFLLVLIVMLTACIVQVALATASPEVSPMGPDDDDNLPIPPGYPDPDPDPLGPIPGDAH